MNFIFYSISNDFASFHRKREMQALTENEKGEIRGICFKSPQLIVKKLFSQTKKKKDICNSIKVCDLYTLLPNRWAKKSKLLMSLCVTLPIKIQTNYAKKKYLNSANCISWFYKPDQYLYLKSLKPYIYLHYDNYKGDQTYAYSHNPEFDTTLNSCITSSQFTLVSSSRLFSNYKKIENEKVLYYPNAISRSLINDNLTSHTKKENKTIGFIGQLDSTFDFELIEKIANRFTSYTITLIGPIKDQAAELLSVKNINIELLGYLDYNDLAEKIKMFDIGICPYKKSDFNQYRNPLKIIEYFSYGIPVVTVKCDINTDALNLVGIANNHEEFIELIENELNANTQQKVITRRAFAQVNCWDNRADFVLKKLELSTE